MSVSPPITWFGGKAKLAARIIRHFPPHHTYVEPFGGSAAVLLGKPAAKVEVYNDIDRELLNLFSILREPDAYQRLKAACEATLYSRAEFELAQQATDEPVEAARRFIVRQRQSHSGMGRRWSYCIEDAQSGMSSAVRRWLSGIERLPAIHQRLRSVQIEADDWFNVVTRYDASRTLFYLDPPYVAATRVGGSYRHELPPGEHQRLVETILAVKGMVVLSGYQCDIYQPLEEAGWQRVDYSVPAYISPQRGRRQESLWLSPRTLAATRQESAPVIDSMREGAYHTHRVRVEATEARIRASIATLRKSGQRASLSAVARHLEISREHLGRRYRHLFEKA